MNRRVIRYALPLIGSQMLQFIGGTAALALLGRLGLSALAAAAAPAAFLALCLAAFSGLTTGAMILAARARGAADALEMRRVAAQTVGAAICIGVLLAALGMYLTLPILQIANVPASLLPIAVPYTHVLAAFMPVLFAYMAYCALLEGFGDSNTPSGMLAAVTLLYLALLVPFASHFSAPGVPLASLTATFAVTIACAAKLYVRRPEFRFSLARPSELIPDRKTLHEMYVVDLPITVQSVAVALSDLAIVGIADGFGASAAAAYAAVLQIVLYAMAPASIFATVASVFGGAAAGAHRDADAQATLRSCLLISTALGILLVVAAYAYAPALIGIFVHDPQTAALARTGLEVMLWSVVLLNAGAVVSGLVDAYGQTVWPSLATVAGVWLVLVPCAHAFSRHAGAAGIWQAYPYAYVSIAVMQAAYFAFARRRGYLQQTAPL